MSGGKKSKVGTLQGGVMPPLLANIYLNLVDKLVRSHKVFEGIDIVRYTDDFVLTGKRIGEDVLCILISLLFCMGLDLNTEKNPRIQARDNLFTFLGFTFHYRKSKYAEDERYLSKRPSKDTF